MTDFSHLNRYKVTTDRTVECHLFQLDDEPSLSMLPASEANKPYFNALLKASRKNVRAVQSKKVNAHTIQDNRNEDRKLYSEFVIKGWNGVVDSKGKDVPFSEANCRGFLQALPDEIFDDVRTFASDTRNFISDELSEDTAKNS